ncbi:MAG: peptidase C39 family protein [Armatimonadetes bacterium]|nr:peptidase C39 family protein [Armatimonadota bacterium]MBS1711713.1 peptidase C39 family protein [Armatimonadota bacterium]MBX3109733.1 peptidase C39 family protein [Fimbriimonadaceae bacterium]
MLVQIAPVLGVFLAQLGSANAVQANPWNFVSLRADDFAVSETATGREFRATVHGMPFIEAVPSWIGRAEGGSSLAFFVRPATPGAQEFCLGTWGQGEAATCSRSSVNDQEDTFGKVSTDTWILKQPTTDFEVRVVATNGPNGQSPRFSRLNFVLSGSSVPPADSLTHRWGTLLDVPMRAQMNYEKGNVLCSPTSISMILAYWSKRMETPQIDADVPEVQAGVFDPGWNGTGNWPFNVAFAASRLGMTGYVTRLRSIEDIEAFVAEGIPVACSVSYGHLKGKGKQDNDGHLVVVVGFQDDGTPIFNDPGRNVVRMTYLRDDFARAWAESKNTVYIVHPKGWPTPSNGPWPQN